MLTSKFTLLLTTIILVFFLSVVSTMPSGHQDKNLGKKTSQEDKQKVRETNKKQEAELDPKHPLYFPGFTSRPHSSRVEKHDYDDDQNTDTRATDFSHGGSSSSRGRGSNQSGHGRH